MKGKLIGFALALLSIATIGVVQLTTEAQSPGEVGSTPRCTVTSVGPRASAFDVKNDTATVKFKATGNANCKVQLSAMSFYAPSMTGKPYNEQILYKKTTDVFKRGTHSMSVKLPSESTKKKGCFYQVDLTYGTRIHSPVLAYGHDKIEGCGQETPKPEAVCKDLAVEKLSRTQFRFNATATTKNGASINGYIFTVYDANGAEVAREVQNTSSKSANLTYTRTTPGDYTAKVVVKTSVGKKDGKQCEAPFTVKPKEVTPSAVCKSLNVETIVENEQFKFNAAAEVNNGATISGYVFTITKDGETVDTKTVNSTATTASVNYTQAQAGDYEVSVTVKTSLGDKTSPYNCVAQFSVTPKEEENPGVDVTKLVENVKYTRVGVNVEYEYEIAVKNTGDIDLTNVVVTDTPEEGITLISASNGSVANNAWTYTIPELKVGETMNFTLMAKVPVEIAGRLTNTVCVDAPEVPGNPDDCDEADVDVEKVPVCNPETGEIIRVDEDEAENYVPVGSPECEEVEVCNPETGKIEVVSKDKEDQYAPTDSDKCEEAPVVETPPQLPQTGAAEVVMQIVGATSLAGAGTYYLASRRRA